MRKLLGLILCLMVVLCAIPGLCVLVADDSTKEQAALTAAGDWIGFVDAGQYSQSWDNTSSYFKTAVKKEDWTATLGAVRAPLGKLISRRLKSKQFMETLPGAPDGEYVVILYESSFENKKKALETITPMLEKDNTWRVSGYYIK